MIKKTFSQILEDLDANFPETFFALMMDECTSYYDTVLIYSFYDGKTRIETVKIVFYILSETFRYKA